MRMNSKKTSLSILMSLCLVTSAQAAWADTAPSELPVEVAAAAANVSVSPSYKLSDSLNVEIKSLLNESSSDGVKIAAVIRMKSSAGKVVKIPDLDLRVRTAEGDEYTLQASVLNAHAIRPNTTEELSYLLTVDRKDPVSLSELVWFSVDWYSFPKTETAVLTVPVSGQSWDGPLSTLSQPGKLKTWGESFQIPNIDSPLFYTPVAISKENSQQGTVTSVKLLVQNRSAKKETLPEFNMDGRAVNVSGTDASIFAGKRVEQGPISLDPQEQRYIHYAIPTDKNTVLSSLNLVTNETFKQLDAKGTPTVTPFSIGRLNIAMPNGGQSDISIEGTPYEYNTPFKFDSNTDAIDPNMDVSLVELHMHENEGEGYQTVIGKYKLTNHGDQPLPIPVFQTKLITENGLTYSGSRQSITTQEIMPNTSYVISYSYIMPSDLQDQNFVLKIVDTKTAAPVSTTLGAYRLALQTNSLNEDTLTFYPFKVKLNQWLLSAKANLSSAAAPSPTTYSYKLKLDLDIERQEQVIVDQNFSKMSFELIDPTGRLLSVKTLSFTGVNRLVSGTQFIQFDNLKTDEQEYPLTVNVYETITTPTGEAKRLVASLKQ
ncbi:hypothetical protein [Paenibacillus sp. UNC451MF]|uniref:hypothetical protein n=1 Tax=Paenibacillus sp. UNC451MF TaxID=1449063 RepID=UPI00048D2F44|nr:hypothetical protein [Paenibacillus sp. UNC451MF]